MDPVRLDLESAVFVSSILFFFFSEGLVLYNILRP
jgi:hypothetical protein